jgi:hypothetical protein
LEIFFPPKLIMQMRIVIIFSGLVNLPSVNIGRTNMANQTNPCHIQKMAQSECCLVEYCAGCGMFHVSVGPTTIRMRLAALHTVNMTLTAALQAFRRSGAVAHTSPANRMGIH